MGWAGDGATVNDWRDPWLPIPGDARVHTSPTPGLEDALVQQFFFPTSQSWDVDILHDIFESRDVKAIQQIPLLMRPNHVSW